MWASLVAICLPAALSVFGAFLGAERAGAFFNSVPMAVLWCALALLLVGGLLAFRSIFRSPGLLGMHAGCVLILAGSMWSSGAAHELRARWLGTAKVHKGYMDLQRGLGEDRVRERESGQEVAQLGFELRLERFWVEYYPLDETPPLYALVRPSGGDETLRRRIDWEPGKASPIPFTDASVRVLDYEYTGPPRLVMFPPSGGRLIMPAKVGEEMRIPGASVTVKVVRVFSNFRLDGEPGEEEPFESAEPGWNPAAELELRGDDGGVKRAYAFSPALTRTMLAHGRPAAPLTAIYEVASPGEKPPPPALSARLEITGGKSSGTVALVVTESEEFTLMPLVMVFADEQAWRDAGQPMLALKMPPRQVQDYKAEVAVIKNGSEVARKVIEVNHPLHYGGYHFYQNAYDRQHWDYTVLSVTSDSGLVAVYAGFVLLCAGTVLRFYVRPTWRRLRRPKR